MAVFTYKCPNCGGALEFSEQLQSWKCEYCLSDFDVEALKAMEEDVLENQEIQQDQVEDKEFDNKARIYSCTSCGAEIVTDDTTAATFCFYCHSPAIIPGQLSGEYRPAKVIPFKLNREKAIEIFSKWCKKKPLLSREFLSKSQLEYISGIYVPFWLFDCDIYGHISADARRVRTWTSGDKRFTETKYYDVSRDATGAFVGIPADGSKKADDHLMEVLEPYDYSQMVDFSMSYLSGFQAEKYDMGKEAVSGRVLDRVHKYSNQQLRDTIIGYSSTNIRRCNVKINNLKATYVLLPTWMFTYKYKEKMYMFAINGQTGKIAGNLPISKKRAAAWFGIISASAFAIMMIGGFFL